VDSDEHIPYPHYFSIHTKGKKECTHIWENKFKINQKKVLELGCLWNWVHQIYSLIWDFLLSQINIWTTTTWSNVWVVLPKPSWYEFLIGFLIWTPASKIFTCYSILQYMCDFIHVLIFITISKCRKSPKLTNIVDSTIYGLQSNLKKQQCPGRFLDIIGWDPSVSGVQPVACWHLSVFSLFTRAIFSIGQ
jgi:hypothetical protein